MASQFVHNGLAALHELLVVLVRGAFAVFFPLAFVAWAAASALGQPLGLDVLVFICVIEILRLRGIVGPPHAR
jgi:hypothetical protein